MSDNYVQSGVTAIGNPTAVVVLNGVTAGNALVAFLWEGSAPSPPTTHTVADGQGSYTAKPPAVNDTTNQVWGQCYILENANAGTHTITGTTDISCLLAVVEVGTTINPSFSGVNAALQSNPGTGADALSSGSVPVTGPATLVSMSSDTSSVSASDEPAANASSTSRANGTSPAIGAYRIQTRAVSAATPGTFTAVTGTHNFITLAMAILNSAAVAQTLMGQASL